MNIPKRMTAALLMGHGGLEKIVVRDDVPVPEPQNGEVLIEVGACGMNNTDINTRIAWYSKSVKDGTTTNSGKGGFENIIEEDAAWGGSEITFPRIQGADIAGRIIAVGEGVPSKRVGQRVIVEPWLRDRSDPKNRNLAGYLGSERDGGFAQYTTVPVENAFKIQADLSDAELATFPCSYSTGEHMLTRVRLGKDENVLIPGASGGVGSALVQLAKRRKAWVLAMTSVSKMAAIRALGADEVLNRTRKNLERVIRDLAPGGEFDVVADVVGGVSFSMLLNLLRRGGRYVTSGAIAGPCVELDLRTLYLKDLEMQGATVLPIGIFEKLVRTIERGEIRPLLAKQFSIYNIHEAQNDFLAKKHVGKFVILPK